MMMRCSFAKPNNFLLLCTSCIFCSYQPNRHLLSFRPTPSSHIAGLFEVRKISDNIKQFSCSMSSDKLLTGKEDDFGGVIVQLTREPHMESSVFASLLRASMAQWKRQGNKGVWLEIPIECVNLVEAAVKEGFYYHHAEPKYLMLVHWIPETNNTLPANATHRVGIGAFVLNKEGQVLVVQEKSGKFRGTGIWKFPTGVVEQGEDICDAAVREVREETGIITEFKEILAFRHKIKQT